MFGSRFGFGLVRSVINEIRFLKNGNRSVSKKFRNRAFQKNLGTEHFGSRLFRFGSGSNQTNRIFSEDLKTIINIRVVRQIYATLCSLAIQYHKYIAVQI